MVQDGDKQKIWPTRQEIKDGWKENKQELKKIWREIRNK